MSQSKTEKKILEPFRFDGSKTFEIKQAKTNLNISKDLKKQIIKNTHTNIEKIADFQSKLYADSKEAVVIVLQALDAAGKDSSIKHVMAGINPQGIDVFSFKVPNVEEASHDFLWRYHRKIPSRGKMAIFNRSWYEEVLVVKVHEFYKSYNMADRCIKSDYFKMKYKQIRNFETYLYENSIRFIKIFLNVSKNEQKNRFLERIERPEKNWKFSSNDLKERQYFHKYLEAFEMAVNNTASENAPWYVLPADQKWYTRYLVSEILLNTLKSINPSFPSLSKEETENLIKYKNSLTMENA